MLEQCESNAIYPRAQLLQLRDSPLVLPLPGSVRDTLLQHGIQRKGRRRGVRAGRKSSRRIPVIVTDHRQPSKADESRPPQTLVTPPRLSVRQTAQTSRSVPMAPASPTPSTGATARAAKHGLSVELLNIQTLLPKLPDIRADHHGRRVDIICYTETNLRTGTPDRLVSIPGYSVHRRDRIIGRKKSGGGVAIYIIEDAHVSRLSVTTRAGSTSHVESLWLKIQTGRRRSVTVACIYRPPSTSSSQVSDDYDDIEEQLQTVIAAHSAHRMILLGDFNSDAHTNPAAYRRLQELEKYGLHNQVTVPTFHRGETHSLLDVVLMSDDLCDNEVSTCNVKVCDYSSHHSRVTVATAITREKPRPMYKTRRNWRAMNVTNFISDVRGVDWNAVIRSDDTCESQWDNFRSAMHCILDVHAPVRRVRVHNPTPPPVSDDTLELMALRRDAKNSGDLETYRALNVTTKRAIREDQRAAITQRVNDAPPSQLYRQLRPVIAPKRGAPTQPVNLTCDELNDYFTSIGTETRDKVMAEFNRSGREQMSVRLPRVNTGALNIMPVTLDQLRRVLFSLPSKAECSEDDIPLSILKISFEVIGRQLLKIINKSIVSETVPSSWKSAIVLPLHKRNDPSVSSNFRPITLVPAICKIVEKLVHIQLTSYLDSHCLFSTDQHGFLAHHSTCTALLNVTDEILQGMDRSEVTLLTLIDLSRCFDVIDHSNLLMKLQQLQISLGWFQSFLEGHTQRVRVGDSLSAPQSISIGTFQGSCLGPLLYNIASNDIACYIPKEINGFRVTLARYADDTQIAITGPRHRLTEMQRSLETVLDTMCTWFMQNGMLVNAAKTELILCGDRRQLGEIPDKPVIQFMSETLSCSETVKNLGVIFDPQLSWAPHIKHITDRCIGILIALLHAKHILPASVLPRIIDSLVFSHLRYCVQVYGSANRTAIAGLQKVFNFAARVLSSRRKYDHISDVLRELEWLDAHKFIDYFDVCLLHKVLVTGEPQSLRSLLHFNYETVQRTTRQSNHLTVRRARNNHGKRLFMYRAVSLYNKFAIDSGIANSTHYAFKKSVRGLIYHA